MSVGCGSGLFEYLLKTKHGIEVKYGVEPSETMAKVAMSRGMVMKLGMAEDLPLSDEEFDVVLLNGVLSYVKDPKKALKEAYRVLRHGGHIVVAFVPAESSYGLLYKLAESMGGWDHPYMKRVSPRNPYPIEFVKEAKWCTVDDAVGWLKDAGFVEFEFSQTLAKHPKYSNERIEQPTDGYDEGDYVAVRARKP